MLFYHYTATAKCWNCDLPKAASIYGSWACRKLSPDSELGVHQSRKYGWRGSEMISFDDWNCHHTSKVLLPICWDGRVSWHLHWYNYGKVCERWAPIPAGISITWKLQILLYNNHWSPTFYILVYWICNTRFHWLEILVYIISERKKIRNWFLSLHPILELFGL